jgi:hypothetical protein
VAQLLSRSRCGSVAFLLTPIVLVALVATSALVVAPSTSATSTAAVHSAGIPPSSVTGASVPSFRVLEQTFPQAAYVEGVASLNSTALVLNGLYNGTTESVLYKVPGNTSRVVGSVYSATNDLAPYCQVAAGGAFFVVYENYTTLRSFWQKITLSGKVTRLAPPLGARFQWLILYGNSSSIYVYDNPILLRIDPATMAVTQNLTAAIPAKVSLSAVLPSSGRLYLAGTLETGTDRGAAWFGYRTNATGTVTNVSTVPKTSKHYYGAFFTIAQQGAYVYVGGGLGTENATGFGYGNGYFYRYDPTTGAFKNESSILPNPRLTVWAIEPWGKTVGLSAQEFTFRFASGFSGIDGGIYELASGGKGFLNATGFLPVGYEGEFNSVTSASGGWFFNGGENTLSSSAQIVAIKT